MSDRIWLGDYPVGCERAVIGKGVEAFEVGIRPALDVEISEEFLKLNIESGTVYEGLFKVRSKNDLVIKAMVYDSRYMLKFENHTFISRSFHA